MSDDALHAATRALLAKTKPKAAPASRPVPLEQELTTPDLESWWLPAPVGEWVDACAASFGVPKAMAIAAALCTAAAVVQGKARVQVRPGWTEPLSLFWLVFSPTGTRKSALLKAATAPIRALQASIAAELEPAIREATNEKSRLELQIARMRRAVKAHRYTEGAAEHLQQLRELEHQLGELVVPLVPRWLYDDINPTMLPRKMRHNQEAEGLARVAVLDAEGTFMANLLGRHSGHVNVDPLLKAYNGEPIDLVRAVHGQRETQDIHIDSANLTLLLLSQPHYLDQIKAAPALNSNGFLGRCLMTHLDASSKPQPFDAPEVPAPVQAAYERWVASLAQVPDGTVWEMPPTVRGELKAIHDRLEADRVSGNGAVGWTVRTLGRVCRIIALTELSNLSNCHEGAGGSARTRVISKLTYLINSLYSQGLAAARAVEPASDPLARLTRRTLHWLATVRQSQIGDVLHLRDFARGLRLPKDQVVTVCDSLVDSGHLEQQSALTRHNKTVTIAYKILSLDPEPVDKPSPVLVQVSNPPAHDDGPPPDPSEYWGDDDFGGEP